MSEATMTEETMRTGVPGLDRMLGGGLLRGRTVLLKGAPGSGKTTIGLQMLIAGATQYDEPGALISFEQQPEQLYADAARFGWDLQGLAAAGKVHPVCISPEKVLQSEGRQSHQLLVDLADMVDDHGVRRVLIDSVSHLEPLLTGDQSRVALMRFLNGLKALGLTPVLTSELGSQSGVLGLEAYLVDAVLLVEQDGGNAGSPGGRWVRILKGRGLNHLSGRHPMEIGPGGITIDPHDYPTESEIRNPKSEIRNEAQAQAGDRLDSGIGGLNELLGGGYAPGSVIFVAGLSGTFKTTVAARFLLEGGAPGLWITFQEDRAALARRFGAEALAEGGAIDVLEPVAGRQSVEKLMRLASERIAAAAAAGRPIRRVVVDGVNELAAGIDTREGGDGAREEAVRWFLRNIRALGVTTLLTQQLAHVTGSNPMTSIAWPDHADTIIYLGLVEIESRLERIVMVLKHRGGAALGDLRGIEPAADGGLHVSDRFVGLSGVLGGTPLGRRKTQIEEIFQPLFFIRDFLAMARSPQLDAPKREAVLNNLSNETQRLIDVLSKYFDEPQSPGGGTDGGGGEGK
jgi:circadian clock protein KaiC